MVTKQWIYTPRAGSKIFAKHPCNEIVVVTYGNGSHDVFHQGAALTWEAAEDGNHFRDALRTLLGKLLPVTGGIAWDVQASL